MPQQVRVGELLRDPRAFDGRRIRATGLWWSGFESSWFAGAWLTRPATWKYSREHKRTYVTVTGTWRAKAERMFGHLGIAKAELEADQIEVRPLVTTNAVGAGELKAGIRALDGELVCATVPIRIGHELTTVDGLPLRFPLDHHARDPVEYRARAMVWVQRGALELLELSQETPPSPVEVPRVQPHELAAYPGEIVDVEGDLVAGEYWPTLGGMELVPPEVTTTARSSLAFGRSTPIPEEVTSWQRRLANGPLCVRARGTVTGRHFSSYQLSVL